MTDGTPVSNDDGSTAVVPDGTRLLVFIVAYHAETTITDVLERIPRDRLPDDCEILVIDDESDDRTAETARDFRARHPDLRLTVLRNPENQGYGGNQKIGYEYAIREGFDVVALLHGDGQYAPERLPELVGPAARNEADAVFGTRMAERGAALRGGMPLYKYVGNRILSRFQNACLGMDLSEFHSGYRVYRVDALERVPFQMNTDDFHFDTEIIIQFALAGLRIAETPIPTYYGDEICRVNGLAYAWNVVVASLTARLQKKGIFYRRRYDVRGADERYPPKFGYPSSHTWAVEAVPEGARVLDLGCGPGHVASALEEKGCEVTCVDEAPLDGEPRPDGFLPCDLNAEPPPANAAAFDCVLLLDILEHLDVPSQRRVLDHIRATAGAEPPRVVVTSGNTAFLITRCMLLLGQFNYGSRGILDMTHRHLFTFRSLRTLLEECGYVVEKQRGVPAPFPAALGPTALARAMLTVNRLLAALLPGVFAYQIFYVARPRPTVEHLLEKALRTDMPPPRDE